MSTVIPMCGICLQELKFFTYKKPASGKVYYTCNHCNQYIKAQDAYRCEKCGKYNICLLCFNKVNGYKNCVGKHGLQSLQGEGENNDNYITGNNEKNNEKNNSNKIALKCEICQSPNDENMHASNMYGCDACNYNICNLCYDADWTVLVKRKKLGIKRKNSTLFFDFAAEEKQSQETEKKENEINKFQIKIEKKENDSDRCAFFCDTRPEYIISAFCMLLFIFLTILSFIDSADTGLRGFVCALMIYFTGVFASMIFNIFSTDTDVAWFWPCLAFFFFCCRACR